MSKPIIFPWRNKNHIDFLIDGQQFYPAILKAIQHAQKSIFMEMYLFESSTIADSFIKVFCNAAKRKLKVQLLIDAYGGLGLSNVDRSKLINAGVQLVFYNPLTFRNFKQNLFRTHRKYLIIDETTLFVGGLGINDSFQGAKAWRETVVKIEGNIAADWHTLFTYNFNCWSNKVAYIKREGEATINTSTQQDRGKILARLAYTSGGTNLEIKKVLLNQINNSKKILWLASAYFIPSQKIRKALRQAAIKGVDVRLLLPGPVTDHPAVRYASRRYYARLLRFGVRIFEYQERFTHTKMILVDDWMSIGSSNMDRWNFRWNLEANLEIKDKKSSKLAQDILLIDFKHSNELLYQQWLTRSKIQRLKEWGWGKIDIWLSSKR